MTEEDPPETDEMTKEKQYTPKRPDIPQAMERTIFTLRNTMQTTLSSLHAHQAAAFGELDVLKNIAKMQGQHQLFRADHNGWKPLHEAARSGHADVLEYLLKEGIKADQVLGNSGVNERTNFTRGGNALYWAQKDPEKNAKAIAVLIEYGGLRLEPVENQERLRDVHVDVDPRIIKMKNTGCCSATLGELREELRNGRDPLERFHTFLWSPSFREFTHACGIELDKFELPIHLPIKPYGSGGFDHVPRRSPNFREFTHVCGIELDKFELPTELPIKTCGSGGCDHVPRRLEEILLNEDKNTRLHDSRRLAMVFHGSRTSNITSILENGLDPSRRTGQALGQGEYFAVDPGLCVAYCWGGKEIIIFLVLVPEENQGHDNDPAAGWPSFQHLRIIVVKENEHQFPIGVLRFKSYTAKARSLSGQLQRQISVAQTELIQREYERNQALIKAQIIQSLIQDESDIAAEKYEKFQKQLSEACKREISMYVHERLDVDVVPFIFPNLPPPYSASEFQNAAIQRVECHAENALKAKAKLSWIKAKFTNHWEQETKRIKGTTTTSNVSMTNGGDNKYNITPLSLASLPEPMKSSANENAMAVASLSGRFLDVNERFCKISGMDAKELRYKSIYHLTDALDLCVIREILSAPMKTKCGGGDDGQTIWLLRGKFEHREDVIQMSVTLIKESDVSKCFAVKLIPKSPSSCPKSGQVTLDQGVKRKSDVLEQCRL